jgi:hypothetical protein
MEVARKDAVRFNPAPWLKEAALLCFVFVLGFSGCNPMEKLGFGEDDEPDGGPSPLNAPFFSGSVDDDEAESAIDMIRTASQSKDSLYICLDSTVETETVSFDETTDFGTMGLVLTAADSPASVVIDGKGRKVQLDDGTGSVITVEAGVTLTLRNIILTGNTGNNAPLIKVNGGRLALEDGAHITDNTNSSDEDGGGIMISGGIIEMTGNSKISDNASENGGGGIFIMGGSVTMSGNAAISENIARMNAGGGVFVVGSGTFSMNGGVISGNNAPAGGGVYAKDGAFNMTGGIIHGSSAGVLLENTGNGAAVYVLSGTSSVDTTDDTVIDGKIQSE